MRGAKDEARAQGAKDYYRSNTIASLVADIFYSQYAEKRRVVAQERREEEEEEKRRVEQEEEEKQELFQSSLASRASQDDFEHGHEADQKDTGAQLPVNLPSIEYKRRGRKQVYIYNKLINRSVILQPKRYGAESSAPSTYVTRNRVNMPGEERRGAKRRAEKSLLRASMRTADTFEHKVPAANSIAVSNGINTPFFATRFARRRGYRY